jgi:GNAT superfamily N-acetyltransferase
MNRVAFEQRIHQHWADHFGCTREDLDWPGTVLLPEVKWAGSGLLAIWQIGKRALVQLDPTCVDKVQATSGYAPDRVALTGDLLRAALAPGAVSADGVGLAFYLYPADLPDFAPAGEFTLRRLTLDDAAAMAALHAANTPEDVDEGYVEVDHEIAFGCFAGDQLLAAASGYRRTGFMDIGVLAHPAYRRRGLGRAAVGALCAWCSDQDVIAQYRCDAENTPSRALAESLNFKFYFRQESIYLR